MTTRFHELEDRLHLAGEVENDRPVVMWLTQRLGLRLLPSLFGWLDRQTGVALDPSKASLDGAQTEVIHSFAQEAATAELRPQPPVEVPSEEQAWLIHEVDLTSSGTGIALTFRAFAGHSAALVFTANELRQWLAILHGVWRRAEWPMEVWPEWIESEAKPTGQQIILH